MSLINLKNPICLAPMAGVTLRPLREFFVKLGAAAVHTEMISCAGLYRNNLKTLDMLETSSTEQPVIVQLFAPEDKILCAGAEAALKYNKNFAVFGINMACPMPKVTRTGSGAALLNKPDMAFNMTKNLKALGLPVWVKIRRLENDEETLRFVDGLIASGADNVCIHGRTCAQRYEGVADRSIIRDSASEFPDMISASGDVRETSDIREYLAMGCAAVMIARGAFSNPFIFEEYGGIFRARDEKIDELVNFARYTDEISGGHRALVLMKRFAGSVLKFEHGSAELRRRAMMSTSLDEITEILRRRY